jgi:hypothetical protein
MMGFSVKSLKLQVKSDEKSAASDYSQGISRLTVLFLVVAVLLLAAWLGARSLNADAIWYDEFWSIYDAGGAHYGPLSPAQIWERVSGRNPWHAPGYFFLLGAWGSFTGWTVFSARSFSLLIGLLVIAWTYRLGRDMRSPLVGLSAAVLLGASALFASYLHELRAYTLYALFTVMTLWAYWRILSPTLRPSPLNGKAVSDKANVRWGLLFLGTLGLLYTHYFAALTAVAIGLYHLFFARKNRDWWRVVIIMGAAGMLFLPWLTVMLQAVGMASADTGRQWRALDTGEILLTLLYAFGNGFAPLALALLGAALFARGRAVVLAWFTALMVLTLALIVNLFLPVIAHIRYLIALWPILSIVAAFGVERLTRWRVPAALLLAIWIGAGVWHSVTPAFLDDLFRPIHQRMFRPDLPWQVMASTIASQVQSEDAVAVHVPRDEWAVSNVFDYYIHPLPVQATLMEWLSGTENDGAYYAEARNFLKDRARVWVGIEQNREPTFRLTDFQRALADEGYVSCGKPMDAPNLSLELYALSESCCVAPETPLMTFGDNVSLRHIQPLTLRDDGSLSTLLGWAVAPGFPYQNYSVALHVLDNAGDLVAQADYGLPGDAYACRARRIALEGLVPGEYTLNAIVYHWLDGTRLNGENINTGERGERLVLGEFEVQ